jgi:RNase P protein component
MKLSRHKLKRIIREETQNVLGEYKLQGVGMVVPFGKNDSSSLLLQQPDRDERQRMGAVMKMKVGNSTYRFTRKQVHEFLDKLEQFA